jgi:hypothetical protein
VPLFWLALTSIGFISLAILQGFSAVVATSVFWLLSLICFWASPDRYHLHLLALASFRYPVHVLAGSFVTFPLLRCWQYVWKHGALYTNQPRMFSYLPSPAFLDDDAIAIAMHHEFLEPTTSTAPALRGSLAVLPPVSPTKISAAALLGGSSTATAGLPSKQD